MEPLNGWRCAVDNTCCWWWCYYCYFYAISYEHMLLLTTPVLNDYVRPTRQPAWPTY